MKDKLTKFSVNLYTLVRSDEGQDLIEYALIAAVVAFAAIGGMHSLADSLNTAFTSIGTKVTDYIS